MTKRRMLIGVTSSALLQKKALAEFLEPYEKRCQNVRDFLHRLCGENLEVDIFELQDPAGRAATDEQITACVLTPEVAKGGEIINARRKENGLPELEIVYADMVKVSDSDDESQKFSNKMSSTLIREHLSKMKKE